jgi:DNA-directed RNA polymerase specialized sigma24 family protein
METNIARLVQGDKEEWDAFVDRFSSVIYSSVKGTLLAHKGEGNEDDVRDLMQKVFVRLVKDDYRLLRTYDPSRASLVTWLTLVARSSTIDFLRHRALRTVPLDEGAMEVEDPRAPTPSLPIFIRPGLLSARQKLVLHLLYDRELSTAEAAGFLGIKEQTVRSLSHKALTRLRRFFKKEDA